VGELDANTSSIAVPLRDHSGEVVAAVSVNGPTARLDEAARKATLEALMSVSARLSAQLGWRGSDAD
jgi:DNA-binding IclR family transcriptional regulator